MFSAALQPSSARRSEAGAQLVMQRESRVQYGPVPRCLFGDPLPERTWQIKGDAFLLRGEGEHYFHYRRGTGVTVERGADSDLSEEGLWLNGSVYSAIASINGLLPIHASAVAFDGKVFAFTGPAESGKSTLVAALGSHGLPMFCDDTLVLDLSDPQRIVCLPGHKRLKLRPDAVALTRASREEKVSRTYDKYYCSPAAGVVDVALPLAELLFLEEGALAIVPIRGAERFARMQDDHQTARLFEAARRFDRATQFSHQARLATQISMTRLVRPLDRSRFRDSVALAASHVTRR